MGNSGSTKGTARIVILVHAIHTRARRLTICRSCLANWFKIATVRNLRARYKLIYSAEEMRLEHIGIAVENIDEAIDVFCGLLDTHIYKTESVSSEGVRTHFLWAGGTKIELLESVEDDSPVARHLSRRGKGLHHLAFDVDDIDVASHRLTSMGYRIVGSTPKNGADGKRIFFLHPGDTQGVLIECCARSTDGPQAQDQYELRNGASVSVYGSENYPAAIVLGPSGDGIDAVLARSIAYRLEPVVRIVLVECPGLEMLDETLVQEVVERSIPSPHHIITVGTSVQDAGSLFLGSSRMCLSWIRIERNEIKTSTETEPPLIDSGLLIRSLKDKTQGNWNTALIPSQAICPDEPEFDALVPMIRSFWATVS